MNLGVLGTWAKPADAAAWGALAIAGLFAWSAIAPNRDSSGASRSSTRVFLATSAFTAAALSLGYAAFYLRGGPRIVDASTYWLQARALSEGHVSWSVPEPSASFRGRFLLFDSHGDGQLAGIFPPGYPMLLALGFLVGVPMIIGPVLAAGLAVATYALARELAIDAGLGADPRTTDRVARAATGLSIVCAALRYHTSDTMAHGATALAVTLSLAAALRARRGDLELRGFFGLAGLGVGYAVATRFASAIPIGVVVFVIASWSRKPNVAILSMLVGMIPWVAVLALVQHATTGHASLTAQSLYYATSDGPPGCFRYGFGSSVGCLVEHGDFVRARMHDSYGLLDALKTTGRRLGHHLGDVANFEPLFLLLLVPFFPLKRASYATRAAGALVLLQIAAYAPFYFDGDYPGGGARFFADVLPVEHALLAVALVPIARASRLAVSRVAAVVLALALVGFAVHESHAHTQLADRDGGRPMFEPDVLSRLSVKRGLLFVDTDHGFALAHDPAAASAKDALDRLVVARLREDDHDRLLYETLGHPTAYVYRFRTPPMTQAGTVADLTAPPSPNAPKLGEISTWSAPPAWGQGSTAPWRFEGESDWPPLAQHEGAWAEPIWATGSCASAGRAMAIHGDGEVRVSLPMPRQGRWTVALKLLAVDGGALTHIALIAGKSREVLAEWAWTPSVPVPPGKPEPFACIDLPAKTIDLSEDAELSLDVAGSNPGLTALDRTTLSPSAPPEPKR